MKIIIISNSKLIPNEAKILTALFESGLETLHLRKPKLSTKKTKELLKEIPKQYHNRIVLHSHHNLARKFNVKGIHLTKHHKKRKYSTWFNVRTIQLKNPKIIITTSYNTIGNILTPSHKYKFDYVFLSPIFDQADSRFQSGFTEFSLKSALSKTTLNVIARGGVDITRIEKANELGFDGIALYSNIWRTDKPVEEFNAIVEKLIELKIPIE